MILGEDRLAVIENIENAVKEKKFNKKVELNDPELTPAEEKKIIQEYLKKQKYEKYRVESIIVKRIINFETSVQNWTTKIIGIENAKGIKTGAIITSNHFNQLDSLIIRNLVKKLRKRNLYTVGHATNLAMNGLVGFIMNHSNIIPLHTNVNYMVNEFSNSIAKHLKKKHYILIYPESEMWFNYRKPRELKTGAYYYAAKNNVPIISCFVEMIDTNEKETEDFYKVIYKLHVLPTIYPDPNKTLRENRMDMMKIDYLQKKEAYEKAYNKKLDYAFDTTDIAGWIPKE